MDFFSAIKEGKVVVVAGAGISKEAPSNLPSWWDYNTVLLQEIGELGAKCLGQNDNLLCVKELMENLPVVSISEFIVNRIVGNSYYPLISLLDGAEPNINHLVLAQLAQSNSIRAIVTTNFDTLLEKDIPDRAFVVSDIGKGVKSIVRRIEEYRRSQGDAGVHRKGRSQENSR